MKKEMEVALFDLLNFFALEANKKIGILKQISVDQKITLEECASKLTEQLKDYCTYRIFDTQSPDEKVIVQHLEELHALANLMLESGNQSRWSVDAVAEIGAWSLLTRLASEAGKALGGGNVPVVEISRLRFYVER